MSAVPKSKAPVSYPIGPYRTVEMGMSKGFWANIAESRDHRFTAVAIPKQAGEELPEVVAVVFGNDAVSCGPEEKALATLFAAAPAQEIIISLIRVCGARFEGSEFCFSGIRYGLKRIENWNELLKIIGWDNARAAIAKAKGEAA